MSPGEVAQALGVTEGTLSNWRMRRANLPFIKFGRRVLYSREAVEAFIGERERVIPVASQ